MTEKEESKAPVQFVEEWALVREAERTLSSRFSNVYIDHDLCIRFKVLVFIHPFPNEYL